MIYIETVNVHVHSELGEEAQALLERVSARLEDVLKSVVELKRSTSTMTAELDRLTQEVSDYGTVEQSAVTLLGQLSDLIRANVTDPAALTKLADDLDTQKSSLAAAVSANTPTADVPAPPTDGGTTTPPDTGAGDTGSGDTPANPVMDGDGNITAV